VVADKQFSGAEKLMHLGKQLAWGIVPRNVHLRIRVINRTKDTVHSCVGIIPAPFTYLDRVPNLHLNPIHSNFNPSL
jgi:hypothetical protein